MLKIERFIENLPTETARDVNEFLRSMLIEVATENYRQLMYEMLTLTGDDDCVRLDPPLRANERVMSGLFSNAIAKVSARSRPEARVDRSVENQEEDTGDLDGSTGNAGRVDFLAWYGRRTLAIELKVAGVNWKTGEITKLINNRWNDVVRQSCSAQDFLRIRNNAEPHRFPSPVSMGVMVLIARSVRLSGDANIDAARELLIKSIDHLTPQPHFVATYQFPEEFRTFVRKKKGNVVDGEVNTPFVIFLVNATSNMDSNAAT